MSNGLRALHASLDERFAHIIADDRMVNAIIHNCMNGQRDIARFPIRAMSLLVACAAVLLFTAATLLLNGSGLLFSHQSQSADPSAVHAPTPTGSAPAALTVTGGDDIKPAAVSVLVTLTPCLADTGLYGYVDEQGVFVIAPLYTQADPFDGDRAAVVLEGQHVVIDMKGEIIAQ